MPRSYVIEPFCTSCGCTEDRACLTERFGEMWPCAWVLLDREKGEGLCTACATLEQHLFALLRWIDPIALAPLSGEPLSVAELARATGRTVRRVRRALHALEARGLACAEPLHGRAMGWSRAERGG